MSQTKSLPRTLGSVWLVFPGTLKTSLTDRGLYEGVTQGVLRTPESLTIYKSVPQDLSRHGLRPAEVLDCIKNKRLRYDRIGVGDKLFRRG